MSSSRLLFYIVIQYENIKEIYILQENAFIDRLSQKFVELLTGRTPDGKESEGTPAQWGQ